MIPRNLLPEGTHYFIAGGWAVCPALATDRDLFVQTTGDLDDTRAMLLDFMRARGFDVAEDVAENNYTGVPLLRVAIVKDKYAQDIHILVTSADVDDVLNTFDISTTQVAITESGRVVKGADYTSLTVRPIRLKDTPTTNERYIKYCERFGHLVEYCRNVTGLY